MDSIRGAVQESAPWAANVPWTLVAVEGAIAAALGVFMITNTNTASTTIMYILAAILLVLSIMQILGGWGRIFDDPPGSSRSAMDAMSLIRGGAGASLAVTAILAQRSDYVLNSQARVILGAGLLLFGILGVVGVVMSGIFGGHNWNAMLADILALVLGAVIIFSNWKRDDYEESDIINYIGWAALIGGAILAIYAIFIKRPEDARKEETLAAITNQP